MRENIHIGTSGWNYDHWKGPFYPEDLPQDQWLKFYTDHFDTVEINNSFYQQPEKETISEWRDGVPDHFLFAAKANRYITHMKKLNDPEESIRKMADSFGVFGDKLGSILFQLPPKWNFNEERLRSFIKLLPGDFRYAFEFRDRSWINDTTAAILEENNIAFCIYHLSGYQSPLTITADFIYIRLHGPVEEKYQGKYDENYLSSWAEKLTDWSDKGKDVYLYFNNDDQGFAVQNALKLKELTGGVPS